MLTQETHAWNPGLTSEIPQRLWPQVTLFTERNAHISFTEAKELSDLTGLTELELISLRPQRLAVHAILVRVTANLTVVDGPNYAQLGINMRAMVASIIDSYIKPELPAIEHAVAAERKVVLQRVSDALELAFRAPQPPQKEDDSPTRFWSGWFGKSSRTQAVTQPEKLSDVQIVENWKAQKSKSKSKAEQACLQALIKCVGTIVAQRGRMLPDYELVARIVTNQLMNTRGAVVVEALIEPLWQKAVAAEGFRFLPVQADPVVMNVKGASASGKSTIRPQQQRLAERLGIPWEDFALISPDYWRKYLIDYESLGEDFRYGAMLSGRELEMIDKKLDAYMADKASQGKMSHMLIDRFRFDSFALDIDRSETSRLLSRFAKRVYLFFMVTHPEQTVTRAWKRGNQTGRYKAVDDLLFHNVEAFTGMPALFLSWVNSKDKQIHFEFLDNDVPLGTLPKTAAFGHNGTLVILDVKMMLNVDRYRKVNVSAQNPDEVFDSVNLEADANVEFALHCARTIEHIVLADQDTMTAYAALESGKLLWWDSSYIKATSKDTGLLELMAALGYNDSNCEEPQPAFAELNPDKEKSIMVGHWNER